IVIAASSANVLLELGLVYGLGWGIAGSAWGTVIAQLGMAAAFCAELVRAPADSRRPRLDHLRPLVRMGGDIAVRTAALYASFLLASAIAAHIGAAALGAHQIAFQLFIFLALVLDAIAIAGQVIVGRALGAGEGARARRSARRMIGWSVGVGALFALLLAALAGPLPHAFTDDPRVIERAHALWPLLALMQPAAGAVFALDGILIGAGDTRYLKWAMVLAFACFAAAALAAYEARLGIAGLWGALLVLIGARLAALAARFRSGRWVVTGATAPG
ncbi:MAG: MATE family efflux transporter, partial [Thermoleophilaceae bacterium]|nr:MATE family efflux transporter [Thermoleophilaceae bacterium]